MAWSESFLIMLMITLCAVICEYCLAGSIHRSSVFHAENKLLRSSSDVVPLSVFRQYFKNYKPDDQLDNTLRTPDTRKSAPMKSSDTTPGSPIVSLIGAVLGPSGSNLLQNLFSTTTIETTTASTTTSTDTVTSASTDSCSCSTTTTMSTTETTTATTSSSTDTDSTSGQGSTTPTVGTSSTTPTTVDTTISSSTSTDSDTSSSTSGDGSTTASSTSTDTTPSSSTDTSTTLSSSSVSTDTSTVSPATTTAYTTSSTTEASSASITYDSYEIYDDEPIDINPNSVVKTPAHPSQSIFTSGSLQQMHLTHTSNNKLVASGVPTGIYQSIFSQGNVLVLGNVVSKINSIVNNMAATTPRF